MTTEGRLSWQQEGRLARDVERCERVRNITCRWVLEEESLPHALELFGNLARSEDVLRITELNLENRSATYESPRDFRIPLSHIEVDSEAEVDSLVATYTNDYFPRRNSLQWALTIARTTQQPGGVHLLGVFDHAIWDGRSQHALDLLMDNRAVSASPRSGSYKEWANRQRTEFPQLPTPSNNPSTSFWREHLEGVSADQPIEIGFRLGSTPPSAVATAIQIDAMTSVPRLFAAAAALRATPFILFLGVVGHCTTLFGGADDTVIRVNVSGRPEKHLDTMGYFADNAPLRLRGTELRDPAQSVALARKTWFSTLEHQNVPWDYLLARTSDSDGIVTRQSAQVLVNFMPWVQDSSTAPVPGISSAKDPTSTFQVAGTVWDDDVLRLGVLFDEGRFGADGAQDFLNAVDYTLEKVVAQALA